jgi:competence protein ComEC
MLSSEPMRINEARQCEAGQHWEWDGVQFMMLSPPPAVVVPSLNINPIFKKRNNISCVLKVTAGDHSILLTGDIEQGAEMQLLKTQASALQSTLLVVPHHGSLTSSSQEFIQAVSPKYALFPVGMANQYGFPKPAVLKRYEEVRAKNLLVWQTGALMFKLSQSELTPPIHWRDTTRRYWHRKLEIGESR